MSTELQQQSRTKSLTFWRFFLIILLFSCKEDDPAPVYKLPPDLADMSAEAALQWADMTLYTLRFSAFNSPTYSSRSLGYLGLAMYESIVPGATGHRSMNGQLNGLTLPLPADGEPHHWLLSLNAAQNTLLKLLYPVPANSHRFIHERIDSLSDAVHGKYAKDLDPKVVKRSVQFGEAIAQAIYDWSLSDGGDRGYTRNFEPGFVFPEGPSFWAPPFRGQTISQYPLHPHWGQNRPFVTANNSSSIPEIIPFSTDSTSAYYKMYAAVYNKDKVLTLEEREIAAWWGDDPTETFSPPGHSYFFAALAAKNSSASLVKTTEGFARVGMAVADAFINCWKIKYTYFNERPSSFVNAYIDAGWLPFWPEPPFPAFPSGHAMHSAAAAAVLTDLYGDSFAFTDRCHEGYRRYDDLRFLDLRYPARTFSSFWEAANECAHSRFLGGIHTQQDNDVAQQEGKKIGDNVNMLRWSE